MDQDFSKHEKMMERWRLEPVSHPMDNIALRPQGWSLQKSLVIVEVNTFATSPQIDH
jgi:hypothetical protein